MADKRGPYVKQRGPGRPFEKGNCANPGGRPKGLAAFVREQTRDGRELVELMTRFARDEATATRDRLVAIAWLADRGFGKVAQPIVDDDDGGPIVVQWGGMADRPVT